MFSKVGSKKLDKSYNMVNAYVQNRKQPRLEVLAEITKILDVDIKQNISITPREAVRLQSFADDCFFEGVKETNGHLAI